MRVQIADIAHDLIEPGRQCSFIVMFTAENEFGHLLVELVKEQRPHQAILLVKRFVESLQYCICNAESAVGFCTAAAKRKKTISQHITQQAKMCFPGCD